MTATPSMRLLAKLMIHHPEHVPDSLRRLVTERPAEATDDPSPPGPPIPTSAPKPRPHAPLTVTDIVNMVAWFYDIGPSDIRHGGAVRQWAYPRFVAFYLARTLVESLDGGPVSFPQIARQFGYDHSSVMRGIQLIIAAIGDDERLRDEIDIIRLHLTTGTDELPRPIAEARLAEYVRYRGGEWRDQRAKYRRQSLY